MLLITLRSKVAPILFGALLVGNIAIAQQEQFGSSSVARVAHRVPKIPVILDGVEFPVGQLPSTDKARFYVVTAEDQEKGIVHAFSSLEWAKSFLRLSTERLRNNVGEAVVAASCQNPYSYSIFNKVRGGGGSDNLFMSMDPYGPFPTLYTNLDFSGWNNTISYVAAACNGYPTALYSCRDFAMSYNYFTCQDPDRYLVSSGVIITDLEPYGFNNRASSLKFGF